MRTYEKSLTPCQWKKIMDDSAGGVEKENDYRDDTQEKGSAQQSYLIPLKLYQLLSLSTLPNFSQDLNHCYNE